MIAAFLQMPHWNVTDGEAKSIAMAMATAQKEFGVNVSPKLAAAITLGTVMTAVNAPRVFVTVAQLKAQKEQAAQQRNTPAAFIQPTIVAGPTNARSNGKIDFSKSA